MESTLYLFDFVKEKEIDLDRVDTVILVDTRQRSRIGEFGRVVERDSVSVHVYDHHPPSMDDVEGEAGVVRSTGATCSILVSMIKERGIEVSPAEATVIMLGLYEETGNFTYPSTTVEDFEAASFLLSKGADLRTVSSFLSREITAEDVGVLNELVSNLKAYVIRGAEVYVAEANLEGYAQDLAVLVQKVREMKNIDALFALFFIGDKTVIIARSRVEDIDVGRILSAFGGGGHKEAASATVKDMTPFEVRERLLQCLRDLVRPLKAKDLMFFPVKYVQESQTMAEAKELMVKYNINTLPVLSRGNVSGIITRQTAGKALFHGLKDVPVREYMIRDFETVEEEDSLGRVKEIIIGHNQRFLPVLREGRLVGGITRTDLLRAEEAASSALEELQPIQKRKGVGRLLRERLDGKTLRRLEELGRVADSIGYHAFVVGGFVRDLIMGIENMDIDVVVEGDGIRLAEEMVQRLGLKARYYRDFGTAKLIFDDEQKIDIATARLEYYRRPATPPVVEFASLKLDLLRRDFTINALAISLSEKDFGQLIDFFGGLRDIKEKTIRVLHSMSFVEDPTRIFRAVRFAERLGFRLSKQTMNLLKNARDLSFLSMVPGKKVWSEFALILREDLPENVLRSMKELDLLRYVHEDLRFEKDKEALFRRMRDVMKAYGIIFHDRPVDRVRYYLLGLLHGMERSRIEAFFDRMGMGKKVRRRLVEDLDAVDSIEAGKGKGAEARSEIFSILDRTSFEGRLFILALSKGEMGDLVSGYIRECDRFRPLLKGEDLKRMGIREGPIYRTIFESIRRARIEGTIRTEEEEREFVARLVGGRDD
jgi:tRNA nucleotidyltransferase (CCA-adding enzyme)